jgi:DNA-binding CsgD family transcriptional regulator
VLVLVDDWLSLVVEAHKRGVEISYKSHWETAIDAFCGRVRGSLRCRVRRIGEEGGLTARELEVLRWFAGGLDQQAIAARRGIARRTVRAHLASIRMKCRVTSSSDLHEIAGVARPTRSL